MNYHNLKINKIYIICGYTDLRKGIDGYVDLVESKLNIKPYDNSLYIFCNKQKNKIKILHFEDKAFWLYYRRMEYIHVKWPKNPIGLEITKKDISLLLSGLKLENSLNITRKK